MGLCMAEALAMTAGTEFMYGVSMSAYLRKHNKTLTNSAEAASSGRKGRTQLSVLWLLEKTFTQQRRSERRRSTATMR